MYEHTYGHGLASAAGNDPDSVWNDMHGEQYINYVTTLSGCVFGQTGKSPKISISDLILALSPMLGDSPRQAIKISANSSPAATKLSSAFVSKTEKSCANHIKIIAANLKLDQGIDESYDPFTPPRPWEEYYELHAARLGEELYPLQSRKTTALLAFAHMIEAIDQWANLGPVANSVFDISKLKSQQAPIMSKKPGR